MNPTKGRVERLIEKIGAEFQAHLDDLIANSETTNVRDGAVQNLMSRCAPFGLVSLNFLTSAPGNESEFTEHRWTFTIGVNGKCEITLMDIEATKEVRAGDDASADFVGYEYTAYKTVEAVIAFNKHDFGIGKCFLEKIGEHHPTLLEKPPLFFRLPRKAPPTYKYTVATEEVRQGMDLSQDDRTVLLEVEIKEHRVDPYLILLSYQSDENFWLADLPEALIDRFQHSLIDPNLGEHHSNLKIGSGIAVDSSKKKYRRKPKKVDTDSSEGIEFSMSGIVHAPGYMVAAS